MTDIIKTLTLVAALAALASPALAKGHDQGATEDPGANVGAETVGPAQTLGGLLGNGNPNGGGAGGSGGAGRPAS